MKKKIYLILAALILAYIVLIFITPLNPVALQKYNLTPLTSRLLSLSIALPLIAIWWAAAFGAAHFMEYSDKIIARPEGPGFKKVGTGLTVLALSLPVGTLFSSLRGYFAATQSPAVIEPFTIFNNYLTIAFQLTAYVLLYIGGMKLVEFAKGQAMAKRQMMITSALITALGGVYIWLSLINPNRTIATTPGATQATYYLPDILIVLTILIPYVAIWFLGLTASFNVNIFNRQISGEIYKKIFKSLSNGILLVVFSSVILQLFTAVGYTLASLALAPLLGIIYVLLVIIGAGYLMIARGARKLKKIEEVG